MKALVVDFSRVLIFANVDNVDSLNGHHKALSVDPNYQIFDHFTLNHELLAYLRTLKDKIAIYVFTDGKLHHLSEVSTHLTGIFTGTYSVDSLGLNKKQPEAYLSLARLISVEPDEILFVDDKISNVEAAQSAGLQALQYTNNKVLIAELTKRLTS